MYLFQPTLYAQRYSDVVFTFHYVSISTADTTEFFSFSYIFTFHYVSISTSNIYTPCVAIIIYIPLCIYFNSPNDVVSICSTLFTFHYVSISTKECQKTVRNLANYLHSTMYLFQRILRKVPTAGIDYLHSTMYLFQPPVNFRVWTPFSSFTFHYVSISTKPEEIWHSVQTLIYIPLCIYFNRLLSVWLFPVFCIYIPLCIYFNPSYRRWHHIYRYLHSTMYLFQPLFSLPFLSDLPDLHSTMYLFQPWQSASCSARPYHIYIPLCIYFNRRSTLSSTRITHIYIPLCIYFNFISICR